MRICVIIPARNEEECIGRLVASLPRPLVSEVIVVDNNSSDRTAELARAAGANTAGDAGLLVFMDGSLSDDRAELPNIVAPIMNGKADLVLGTRTQAEPSAYPAADRRQPRGTGSDRTAAAPAPAGPAIVQGGAARRAPAARAA